MQPVLGSVHFGDKVENAFWGEDHMQIAFGDGEMFLHNFSKSFDVIGHEMTHAISKHTSPLDALSEHIADVFGIMAKQWDEHQTAHKADWLFGRELLRPNVMGVALRSMKAPGTACNDPLFNRQYPQPDNFSGFYHTKEHDGGAHMFSVISNRAFYLASVAFGGYSWETAGQIWWKALKSGRILPRSTFIQFANVIVDSAEELFDDKAAKIVRKAWDEIGVVQKRHY